MPIFDDQDHPQYISTECQENLAQNIDASCNTDWDPGKHELSEDSPLHERERRFVIGGIALAATTAATAMGVYNTIQIEFLKTELTEVKENSRRLFEVADIQEHQLLQVEISINIISTQLIENLQNDPALYDSRLTRVENQIRDKLRATTHALQAAQHNRLSIDYLSPQSHQRAVQETRENSCGF